MTDAPLLRGDGWCTVPASEPRPDEVAALDPLLHGTEDLWRGLETLCARGCCGLDAFDFEPDAVQRAVPPSARAAAVTRLQTLASAVEARTVAFCSFATAGYARRLTEAALRTARSPP